MKLRRDPLLVREVLASIDQHGVCATVRQTGLTNRTIYRWIAWRAQNPSWPTDDDVAEWNAHRERRARAAAHCADYRKRVYVNRGPILTDATGVARRLQALAVLGWTSRDLAPLLGVSDARVQHLTNMKYPKAHPDTIAAVRALYDRLSMTVPVDHKTTGRGGAAVHARQRRAAAAKGYLPPLAWDDDTIDDPRAKPHRPRAADQHRHRGEVDDAVVERILAGERMPWTTPAEKVEVRRRWVAAGRSLVDLEDLMGWNASRYDGAA